MNQYQNPNERPRQNVFLPNGVRDEDIDWGSIRYGGMRYETLGKVDSGISWAFLVIMCVMAVLTFIPALGILLSLAILAGAPFGLLKLRRERADWLTVGDWNPLKGRTLGIIKRNTFVLVACMLVALLALVTQAAFVMALTANAG